MSEELKPCPFCGGPEVAIQKGPNMAWIACFHCDAQGPLHTTRKGAITAWNRRDHIGTHGDECWKWGPSHYECAMREIECLTAMIGPQKVLRAEEVTEPGFYLVRADNTNPWVPCVIARFNARSEGLRMLLAGKSEELPVIGELTPIKMTEV